MNDTIGALSRNNACAEWFAQCTYSNGILSCAVFVGDLMFIIVIYLSNSHKANGGLRNYHTQYELFEWKYVSMIAAMVDPKKDVGSDAVSASQFKALRWTLFPDNKSKYSKL